MFELFAALRHQAVERCRAGNLAQGRDNGGTGELAALVAEALAEGGFESPAQVGQAMKAAMAKVAGGVAWDRFDGRPASLGLDDPRLVAIASADAHQLIAWIAHDDRQGARPAAPARIGLPAGRWTARCYDDTTGELLSEAQVEGEIVTPAFERHLAMVLQAGSLGTMRV